MHLQSLRETIVTVVAVETIDRTAVAVRAALTVVITVSAVVSATRSLTTVIESPLPAQPAVHP